MFTPNQLADQVKALNKAMGDAAEAQELYRASLADPSYQAFTAWLREETRLAQDTFKVEKQLADLRERESLVSTGTLEKQLARQNALRTQGIDIARQENLLAAEARRNYLASGAYSQQVLGNQPANRINQQSDHSQQLIERYAAAALRSEAIRTGDFHMQARENESTARFERHNVAQESRITQTVRNEGRRDDLRSGFTRNEALADARVRLESDRLAKQEARVNRSALLEAKYGATLGKVVQASESPGTRAVFGGIESAGNRAYGMAMSGFSNTVEMNQFQREMHLISREMAASLAPALKGVTAAARGVREWMGKLSGPQQDALGLGIGGVVATGMAAAASRKMFGMGLIEAGANVASWVSGNPTAAVGAKSSSRLQGLPAPVPVGAKSSSRLQGVPAPVPVGGSGGGSTIGKAGSYGMAIAGAVEAYDKFAAPSKVNTSDFLQATPLGSVIHVGKIFSDDPVKDSWNYVVRQLGKFHADDSRFQGQVAALKMGDHPIASAANWLAESVGVGPESRGWLGRQLGADGHRAVTPADVGYGAVGSSYERLSQATDMVTTQDDLVEAMNTLADVIRAQNPDRAPPPEAGT